MSKIFSRCQTSCPIMFYMVYLCLTSFWEIKMPAPFSSRSLTLSSLRIRFLWISHRPSHRFNQEWTTSCPKSHLISMSLEGYSSLWDKQIRLASSIKVWPFVTSIKSWQKLCLFMNTLTVLWLFYLRMRKTSKSTWQCSTRKISSPSFPLMFKRI